jgi:glycosyltransferase involved in cell wall biosynthesis
MRVLVCYPWLDLGGAPKTAITLAKGLKERGHEVFFFSRKGGMYEKLLEEAGIPLISAPHHAFFPLMFHLNLKAYRILKKAVEDYSIDIIHAFHHNSYFLSLFVAPGRDIPVLFTAVWYQGTWPYPAYPGRVIFVAEEFLDHARPYLGKHAREMIVLPNRIDLDRFSKDTDWTAFSDDHGLPRSGVKLAFMSRLGRTKIKSVNNAMDAVDILAGRGMEVTLAIAGDGPLYEEVVEYAGKINNKHSRPAVRAIGPIGRTPEFMAWADIVLGIGRSAFEGMATEKPTCIVGENGLAGIVDRDTVSELQYYNFAGRNVKSRQDPSVLADTIERIVNDSELYGALAKFSRRYVIDNYGYRTGAERLEKIYTNSLSDPHLGLNTKIKIVVSNYITAYCRNLYRNIKWKLKRYITE